MDDLVSPPEAEQAFKEAIELPMPAIPALVAHRSNGFRWFRQLVDPVWPDAEPDATSGYAPYVPEIAEAAYEEAAAPSEPSSETRGGLRRRVKGAQLPSPAAASAAEQLPDDKPRHDPEATKAAMDGFQTAFAKAAEVTAMRLSNPPPQPATVVTEPVPPPTAPFTPAFTAPVPVSSLPPAHAADPAPITSAPMTRGGMVRRVPGAQLAPGLRQQPAGRPIARAVANRTQRDPAAERAAFDAFADGLAKAGVSTADTTPPDPGVVAGRVMERGEESRK
jgi:hypothetical protein